MAKLTLKSYKQYVESLDQKALQVQLLELYTNVPAVKLYVEQRLASPSDRQQILESYKKKIKDQFWTRTGNPRDVSNAKIRAIITEFEKIAIEPTDIINLLIYRVELATQYANEYGGMPDASYTASENAFEKALKLMEKHGLVEDYREQCEAIFEANNLAYWYIESLKDLLEQHTEQ